MNNPHWIPQPKSQKRALTEPIDSQEHSKVQSPHMPRPKANTMPLPPGKALGDKGVPAPSIHMMNPTQMVNLNVKPLKKRDPRRYDKRVIKFGKVEWDTTISDAIQAVRERIERAIKVSYDSVNQFCEDNDLPSAMLYNYLNGKSISAENLIRIWLALDIDPLKFMPTNDARQSPHMTAYRKPR